MELPNAQKTDCETGDNLSIARFSFSQSVANIFFLYLNEAR
jgi:hypothetical protein